ncbi:UDP-N-acetylmuramoylalanyl-D-glutamate-2,6-diaminopimelate ligase protein [Dioscorea alata]|uniref:UDP-N-acetylmuramoylalanyl-D-glutamate-2, 6-diaminopimelate ligase protein n=1 Tax=Dioscorea alata TaxID=55571 RepID=A0ACB7UQU0_DIOAL|nr:UDP-N-acetylmuramoylalanyl-D-glutamate-2,6-diaminopimelate ligase protein [Dioscorea alata]
MFRSSFIHSFKLLTVSLNSDIKPFTMALSAISLTPFSLPSSLKTNPKLHCFVCSHAFKPLNSSNAKPHLVSSPSLSNQQKLGSSFGFDTKHQAQTLTLTELLEKSNVTPVLVHGDLSIPITGIKNDSRKVIAGDVFISCFGYKTNGHLYIKDAVRRGAVAVVVSEGMEVDDSFSFNAVIVVVKNTNAITPVLASTFYNNPSKSLKVIGITGTNGKTTATHLVRSLLNALSMKTGMLGTVGYHVDGGNKNQLEASNTTPDSVSVQELMAKMVKRHIDAVVMEVSSIGLAVGRCNEIDFDIAVFMNLTRDHHDFHGNEEEYKKSKAKLFKKMTDKRRHRKVINFDDPNAAFFAAQGNPEVPMVSFAMEDKSADVHPLKIELNMFKTKVWVKTPNGVVKISSGLIGRYNVYNILACAAVGVALGAPLKDIARGIENVDGVPGNNLTLVNLV